MDIVDLDEMVWLDWDGGHLIGHVQTVTEGSFAGVVLVRPPRTRGAGVESLLTFDPVYEDDPLTHVTRWQEIADLPDAGEYRAVRQAMADWWRQVVALLNGDA